MKQLLNNGSYIVITPIKQDGLWKGEVLSYGKYRKQFNVGDIIYYKDEDMTQVIFKGQNIHLVLYYHIVFIEKEYIEPIHNMLGEDLKGIKIPNMPGEFKFNGLEI